MTDHGGLTATAQTYLTTAGKKPGDIHLVGFDLLQICLAKTYGFAGLHIDTDGGFADKANIDFLAPLAEKEIR